jgi:hypothetical protein
VYEDVEILGVAENTLDWQGYFAVHMWIKESYPLVTSFTERSPGCHIRLALLR